MTTKHEVLQAHLPEWMACKGDKKKRGELTKKLSQLLGINKKSVGRSMKRLQLKGKPIKENRGRKLYYGNDVKAALFTVWEEMEYPCAENMHSSISDYINYFLEDGSWKHSEEATEKLRLMSMGTLKGKITQLREKYNKRNGRSATVSSPLKGMIPIRKSHTWKNLPPGYMQTDSVVHCGDVLTDDVIYSVGCVNFATYWSEYEAQWNKGESATLESLKTIGFRFPFPVLKIHPDTGNEYINYHVYTWTVEDSIGMTRSEPYKKNDNMCIEERNGNIPHKHLGYGRLDDPELLSLVQEILKTACLLENHFRAVRRMTSKERVGGNWKKTYEKEAKTPYLRVLERKEISEEEKEKLKKEHESLNPLALKRNLDMLKQELGKKIKTKA